MSQGVTDLQASENRVAADAVCDFLCRIPAHVGHHAIVLVGFQVRLQSQQVTFSCLAQHSYAGHLWTHAIAASEASIERSPQNAR